MAALDSTGVHVQGVGVDVDKHRPRTRIVDSRHCGHEGAGDGDHLIARTNACREQGEMECARAGVDADSKLCTAVRGKLLLERSNFLAQGELRAGEGRLNCGEHFFLDALVLCFEIKKRHHGVTAPCLSNRSSRDGPAL